MQFQHLNFLIEIKNHFINESIILKNILKSRK